MMSTLSIRYHHIFTEFVGRNSGACVSSEGGGGLGKKNVGLKKHVYNFQRCEDVRNERQL